MKAKSLIYAAVAVVACLSCTREMEDASLLNSGEAFEVRACWAREVDSRTMIAGDGSRIVWTPGESINLFYGSQAVGKFTSTNTDTATVATFTGAISIATGAIEWANESARFFAVYPYNEENSCDGQKVSFSFPSRQTAAVGTFSDNFFPAVAASATTDLQFYNVCGGARFSLVTEGVERVVFRSVNGSPMAGKIKLGFDEYGRPYNYQISDPVDSIVVSAPDGGFVTGENYFAAMLPQTHASGMTVTLYTTTKRATKTIGNAITVKRSVFGVLDNVDEGLTDWEDHDRETEGGGTRSGMYVGIIGFNQQLYKMPITRLEVNTLSQFTSFINNLSTSKGTLLYYSVDQAVRTLSRAAYPDDLFNVSLVTFTDGLDQGSAMMIEDYPGDDEYLQELNVRLSSEQVKDLPLTAYSVGLKGSDVSDAAKFSKNLQKLAYPSSNAFEVSSMSTVNSRFQAIADQLSQTLTRYSYDLSISIPGPANDTRVRFTLDNVSNATLSNLYIEGVFNLQTKSLTGITCRGLTLPAGDTVKGEVDGIFVRFPFNGVVVGDGQSNSLSKSYIKHWYYIASSSKWQINSEFDAETDVSIEVTTTKKSAVVLLNLDCSSSLGSDFSTLKTHAKSFVQRLYDASVNPLEVSGVSLDKSELILLEGQNATLKATVSPSNAENKSVVWKSSNPSVVKVSETGAITALRTGIATILVTTVDGGCTDRCKVTVCEEMVDLGLSVKWASCNLGASTPDAYGNYYAWGETAPKSAYLWSTYSWCQNGSSSQLTRYCTNSSYGYNGFVDNKTVLDSWDDAATVNLGGSWRMPTLSECLELWNNCTNTWTSLNGVYGRKFTSKKTGYTDKWIFLPAAGYRDGTSLNNAGSCGYYWSSSLSTGSPYKAFDVYFDSGGVYWFSDGRFGGLSVRPVSE